MEAQPELKNQRRLLTWMLTKKVPPIPSEDERKPYPLSSTNIVSRVMFWWLFPILNKGYKRTLLPEDLWVVDGSLSIESMSARFYKILNRRVETARVEFEENLVKRSSNDGDKGITGDEADNEEETFKWPRMILVMSLLETFWFQYATATLFLALSSVVQSLTPLLTKQLIAFVEGRVLGIEPKVNKGIGYSIGAFLLVFANGLFINHFFHNSMLTGAQAKAILTKALLDKSFKLNAKAKHDFPTGKITSLMGTDLARIDLAIGFQPFVVCFPISMAIGIGLLIHNIGVSALAGIGVFVFSVIIIVGSTKTLFKIRKSVNFFTDKRVAYMREVLTSIKVIKYYAWEDAYEKNISETRQKEMDALLKIKIIRNFITAFAISLPSLTSMVAFCVMYAISKGRNAADIFSSVSLFSVLSQTIFLVPIALASGADALAGLDRTRNYLSSGEEVCEDDYLVESTSSTDDEEKDTDVALRINKATFKWDQFFDEEEESEKQENEINEGQKSKTDKNVETDKKKKKDDNHLSRLEDKNDENENEQFSGLIDIDLTIKKNEFIIITGSIGSGKSSLLSAIAGFMPRRSGSIDVNGSLLLCGYPWVQNATVRENILFGAPYDEERYKSVIYACALESDLDILPAGDKTEIGERGITLSGGQKARINLARAVYHEQEIILLDDVLSAVDARVGKHIMDNCLMGLLKDKTRILATHQLSLIGSTDRVVFLNGDGSMDIGSVPELLERNIGFSKLMEFSSETKEEEEEEEIEKEIEREEDEKNLVQLNEEELRLAYDDKDKDGTLINKEESAVNTIPWEIYKTYIVLGSGFFKSSATPIFFFLLVISTFCQLFTNVWLSFWTEKKFHGYSEGFYIGIYIMFTFLTIITLTLLFTMLAYMSNEASEKLNIRAVKKIIHTPMSFMDTTPMGRILNRFTKDTDSLDNEIAEQLRLLFYPLATIVGVVILCIVYLPWFAIAVPFLVILFVVVSSYYQASSREIKRLEAVQRSFVYNNFNEVLNGMNTIKAYNAQQAFIDKSDRLINKMNEAYYITIANQRWIAIHLDLIASAFALIIALLCVTRQFSISAASTGVLLSYVLQIVGLMSLFIRALTQVENEMNSVERLCQYANKLPQEAAYQLNEKKPHPDWPSSGEIIFEDVSMSYRPGLPLVLKDLNLSIKPLEKIGICGRTGAGKSSIMTALYRLSELSEGKIIIDGTDISQMGLYDLRSKLSIIPQDPVLFQGSVRKNLDPFNEHTDETLWGALRRSGLIDVSHLEQVKAMNHDDNHYEDLHKFHLDQLVEDEGANFSLGERQLIALARALVRNSKILILDEATSSVDYETDSKIQSTIVNEFGHCTILCIAHRLKTILNYDRILVLDKGEIKELDTPANLYKMENSIFRQMCERSNITAKDFGI